MVTRIVKPYISLIIRAKNEERFIGKTLNAVFEQKIEMPYEVIVIDSGSIDRTLDIVRQFKVRLYKIKPDQFTFGHALNYGASFAEGEYIINLSAHCIPVDSNWMRNLIDPLLSDPSIAATYGRQEPIKGLNPFEEQCLMTAFSPNEEGHVRHVFSNSNCAIRKQVREDYPFDEKASFAEDFIWANLLPSEYKIKYVHTASVFHSHPLTFKYWAKRYYDDGLREQYVAHVYDFKNSWDDINYRGKFIIAKKILRTIRSYLHEFSYHRTFLLRYKYFRYLPIVPFYVILKRHYLVKGDKKGKQLYKSYKRADKLKKI